MEILAILLFVLVFLLILKGYPVAFTLGGVSVLFGFAVYYIAPEYFHAAEFNALASRFKGVINNAVLMAVPLFIFMGIMLEKSRLAENMLETMAVLFGKQRGGLAISVVIVGALLAASTGIVGATVVTMGLISLPTMLKRNYQPELATGTIAASGTLGQIIPPSIVLVLLADTMGNSSTGGQVDVGSLFRVALIPGVLLVVCYIIYIVTIVNLNKDIAPPIPDEEIAKFRANDFTNKLIWAFVMPLSLIVLVLGSILASIASPTEAAAVGAIGATALAIIQKKFNWQILREVMQQTTHLTAMVFLILLGATTFSLVFRTMGGDTYLVELIQNARLSPYAFLLIVMLIIFITGFFIDFIEIIFIIVPVVTPIFESLGMDMLWIGVLIAMNLQTSFLTPPFGFSLFYLKGVAPANITTQHIYRGIIPFIIIQIIFLGLIVLLPNLIYLW